MLTPENWGNEPNLTFFKWVETSNCRYSLLCLGGIKTCVLQNNAGCVPLIVFVFFLVYFDKNFIFQEICGSLSSLIPPWGVETLDSDVWTSKPSPGAIRLWCRGSLEAEQSHLRKLMKILNVI